MENEITKENGGEYFHSHDWDRYPFGIIIINPRKSGMDAIRFYLTLAGVVKEASDGPRKLIGAFFDNSETQASAFAQIFHRTLSWKTIHYFKSGVEMQVKWIRKWIDCYLGSIQMGDLDIYCHRQGHVRVENKEMCDELAYISPCRFINLYDENVSRIILNDTVESIAGAIKVMAIHKGCHYCPNMRYDKIEILRRYSTDIWIHERDKLRRENIDRMMRESQNYDENGLENPPANVDGRGRPMNGDQDVQPEEG